MLRLNQSQTRLHRILYLQASTMSGDMPNSSQSAMQGVDYEIAWDIWPWDCLFALLFANRVASGVVSAHPQAESHVCSAH